MDTAGFRLTRRDVLRTTGSLLTAATLGWPTRAAAQAAAPKRGGTLRVSNGGDPPDFDIQQTATYLTQFLAAPCYSTLMREDVSDPTRVVPELIERWDIAADGRTVTLHVRKDVAFHNGDVLTAEDVKYNLDRIRVPPKGIVSPRKGQLANIESVEVRGPLTAIVHLKQPQPDFLFLISNPFNGIYPKKVVEPLDQSGQGMKRQIVGTGPFRLARATEGQIYELVRNEKYWGPAPYLDRMQFFPIKGEVERAAALQGKRVDGCFFFASESVLQSLAKVPGMVTLRRPNPIFINLIPNVTKKPFDDPRVREALSLAIDREAFIKTVGPLAGAFYHSLGLMPPKSPYSLTAAEVKQFSGYDTLPGLGGNIAANRQKAIALLEQAGVPKGFKIVIPTRGDVPAFRDSAINVSSQLKLVGLDATVDVRDAGAFYQLETKGDFQIVMHSVAIAGAQPDQILGEGYTSFGGRNYGGWKNEALDDLYRAQSAELDAKKRVEAVRQFQLAFLKTYNQVNLAWVGYAAAHASTLHGWVPMTDLYNNMQMSRVWLST